MKTVVGLFDTFDHARSVVGELVDGGFDRDNISLVANDASGEYATYTGDGVEDGDATAAGATTGAVVGGTLGVLAGLGALGALVIPGIGPVIAAGPLLAGAAGAGVGALAGGLLGALVDAGVPDDDAEYYTEGVRRGGALVMVRADDELADRAADIMNRNNAVDVNERGAAWREQGWSGYDDSAEPFTAEQIAAERSYYSGNNRDTEAMSSSMGTGTSDYRATDTNDYRATDNTDYRTSDTFTGTESRPLKDEGEVRIPVVEEEMRVGKREVEGGGVRVTTDVSEKPFEEEVTLRQEHVEVERHPVDREATEADFDAALSEGTLEVTESREEAVVDKRARVVEEVVINKDVEQTTEHISDSVRRTDVNVEELDRGYRTDANNEFDRDYRSDYDANFANSGYTYEQYTPAYRYGSQLASDTRYQGREWTDVENDARTRWEERNPGTWEQFKDAARHAWDKARGRA